MKNRKVSLFLVVLIVVSIGAATIYKHSGFSDKSSILEGYIPKDLEDCFVVLEKTIPSQTLKEMKDGKEEKMIVYHFSAGMSLRNGWGLWGGSRLSKYFNSIGIYHPDDMSGIILKSFWRHLNNKPIKLEEQVKYYQTYWEAQKKQKKKVQPTCVSELTIQSSHSGKDDKSKPR